MKYEDTRNILEFENCEELTEIEAEIFERNQLSFFNPTDSDNVSILTVNIMIERFKNLIYTHYRIEGV